MHGVAVTGGRYGLYLPGTQPSPLVSDVTLQGQDEAAIYYRSRGPLTVVGADIRGAGIRVEGQHGPWNGPLTLVDSVFSLQNGTVAVMSDRSVVFDNVWFENAATIARITSHPPVAGNAQGWTHIQRYAAGAKVAFPKPFGVEPRHDAVWVDRKSKAGAVLEREEAAEGPPSEIRSRHCFPSFPNALDAKTVNVRAAPYGAKGDGHSDDASAIQAAIDEHDAVFLPKGKYLLSKPLRLNANTTLLGVSNLLSVLAPLPGAQAFNNPDAPQPLIETVDERNAQTRLAMLKLELPSTNPASMRCVGGPGDDPWYATFIRYALSGTRMRQPTGYPWFALKVRAEGAGTPKPCSAGGLKGPTIVTCEFTGMREPLRFYHLQPQHARSEAMVELNDAQNVDIYSMKAEGDYTAVWIRNCRNVRFYGYGGILSPRPRWPVIRIDNSDDLLLANICPQVPWGPHYGALGTTYHPATWFLLADGPLKLPGTGQFAMYQLGRPDRYAPPPKDSDDNRR